MLLWYDSRHMLKREYGSRGNRGFIEKRKTQCVLFLWGTERECILDK